MLNCWFVITFLFGLGGGVGGGMYEGLVDELILCVTSDCLIILCHLMHEHGKAMTFLVHGESADYLLLCLVLV